MDSAKDPSRGSALSWVTTLAHHKAVDRIRSAAASRRRETAEVERSRTTPVDQTAAAAHASLEAAAVHRALATLTPSQRQALQLAYFGGYTHTEVSRLMQLPLGTVKGRIRDGLLRLRASLSAPAAEPA